MVLVYKKDQFNLYGSDNLNVHIQFIDLNIIINLYMYIILINLLNFTDKTNLVVYLYTF